MILLEGKQVPNDLREYFEPVDMQTKGSVLRISTRPYSGSHFAVFPPALVEPCILAGTSARGACPVCGAAWARITEKTGEIQTRWVATNTLAGEVGGTHRERTHQGVYSTTGWQPACACEDDSAWPDHDPMPEEDAPRAEWEAWERVADYVTAERRRLLALWEQRPTVPCVCLDPFAGSGTVGTVCAKHGREFVGLDLNAAYLHELAGPRLAAPIQMALEGR